MGAAPLILVADDDQSCRKLVTTLLRRIGFETIEAKTGRETLESARRRTPNVVLLDVNLPDVSGYEVCHELRDDFGQELAVIFLSGQRTTASDRVAGLLVGADDYIVKPFNDDELLARVRAALRRVAPRNGNGAAATSVWAPLTAREREILRLLASGLTQNDIAAALFISPKTVGGHIQRVLTKLGVHSRAQAVALAHEHGLVDFEAHALRVSLGAV